MSLSLICGLLMVMMSLVYIWYVASVASVRNDCPEVAIWPQKVYSISND